MGEDPIVHLPYPVEIELSVSSQTLYTIDRTCLAYPTRAYLHASTARRRPGRGGGG